MTVDQKPGGNLPIIDFGYNMYLIYTNIEWYSYDFVLD